ncbi:MAG TPA: hypothetical protein VF619_07895 [Allosphingosinicella sp.]|jgi:hypothetical protein
MLLETMTAKQIASATAGLAEELGSSAILELSQDEVARVSGGAGVSAEPALR